MPPKGTGKRLLLSIIVQRTYNAIGSKYFKSNSQSFIRRAEGFIPVYSMYEYMFIRMMIK